MSLAEAEAFAGNTPTACSRHVCGLQTVGKVSGAARGLCLWVRAMETYGTVAKDVAPKRKKLKTAQDNLSKKQTALAAAQTQLAEVLAKVQTLKVSLTFCMLCAIGNLTGQYCLAHVLEIADGSWQAC